MTFNIELIYYNIPPSPRQIVIYILNTTPLATLKVKHTAELERCKLFLREQLFKNCLASFLCCSIGPIHLAVVRVIMDDSSVPHKEMTQWQ